jgi:formylglycine-generating enzyme
MEQCEARTRAQRRRELLQHNTIGYICISGPGSAPGASTILDARGKRERFYVSHLLSIHEGAGRRFSRYAVILENTRMWVRRMGLVVVLGLWLSGLYVSQTAATEPVPAKPDSAPSKPAEKPRHPTNGNQAAKFPVLPAAIIGKDGAPMVLVPAGEFFMGSPEGDDDEQPVHRVVLDSFYIDTFEVTNGRFAKFVAAIGSEPPWGFADQETPVSYADRPVRWVNWLEATGYCLWAGKRLPTEAEWEKGARGTDGRTYPWGNEPPTPAHAVFGLKEGADTVSPIGNREQGKSPWGVHDLAGNLYEWVADWYDEAFYSTKSTMNPRGPVEGTAKVQRGGSYFNQPYRLRSAFRTKSDPTEHDPRVGFRCAQDVSPHP